MPYNFRYFLFFAYCSLITITNAQQITVTDNQTAQQLVESTLDAECVLIENVSSPVNGSSIGLGSFGFFERGSSNFPFSSGMILTTGSATSGGNTLNTDILNEGDSNWVTDNDLENTLGITNTTNATAIEFDFTSTSNTIEFNYIFASEEYFANFPCSDTDSFAFLIREAGTNNPYTNIALIPNTTITVNATTVHDEVEGFCNAENPEFFDGFNLGDTNYNGRTTVLTATANIIPNVAYQIKMVIADFNDEGSDSAIFIEANSFSPTVDLGEDFSTCADNVDLDADINNNTAQYEWFLDGNSIAGETSPQINITTSGLYSVQISIPLGSDFCVIEDEINVSLSNVQSATPMTDFELCDDLSNDGIEIFNLNTKDAEAIASVVPGNYNVSYHISQSDAENNSNPIIGNYTNTISPEIVYVRIVDIDSGCLAINQFQVVVNERPMAIQPPTFEVCDNNAIDGFANINLNENDDIITNNSTNLVVTYHLTQIEADNGINALSIPYVNTNPTETLFVNVTNPQTQCSSTTTIDVVVLTPPDIDNNPIYYIDACDQEFDGFANFDLTQIEADILNGLTGAIVSYHLSQEDAQTGDNPIPDPTNFENTVAPIQRIFIRVVGTNGCPSIAIAEVQPNLLLTGPDFTDEILCDIDNDGVEAFNLASLTERTLDDIDERINITITYYETEDDRTNGNNPIDTAIEYTPLSFPQTLFLQIDSPTCSEPEEIILDIQPITEFPDLSQQTVCDRNQDNIITINLSRYDQSLTQGQTGFSVTYFETLQDAENNSNVLPTFYQNTVNPFNVFARITSGDNGCSDISTFQILVNPAPETSSPNPIVICDDDQDALSIINLEGIISEVVADTSNREISFYNSPADANTGNNRITETVSYNAQTETIYIRIENETTSCFSIETLSVTVNTLPVFISITDFVFCENNSDDIGEFLLSSKDAEILNGQTEKEVLYFLSLSEATTGINPIDKNNDFENTANPQEIFVRVQNFTDINCFDTSSFELNVDTNPLFNEPTDVFPCDDISNDTFTPIDLSLKTLQISENIPENLTVSYFATLDDFNNQTNEIMETVYTTVNNPQEIFVSISNGSDCTSETSFVVNVIPVPTVTEIEAFEDCDVDYDGQVFWDLTDAEINILDIRQNNIIVSYFVTEENAEDDVNEILDIENFENTTNPQTVFVKVTDTNFNCPLILPIELNVILPPTFTDFGSFEICETADSSFNLLQINEVFNVLSDSVEISYFDNEQDATDNSNQLSNNYTYQTNNDVLFARIENTSTSCFFVYQFTLIVNDLPIANTPNDLSACDDDDDRQLIFDLNVQDNQILGTQNNTDLEITYHASLVEAVQNINGIVTPYNAINNEVIFARVTNTVTNCFSITDFAIIINPLPIVNIEDQALCPDNFPLLVDASTGSVNDQYLWSTGETSSSIEITEAGTYSVTITTSEGCNTSDDFNVTISEPANIQTVEVVNFSDPNNITITVSGIGDYLFQLDDGPLQENGLFQNVTLGIHLLTIYDELGCSSVTREVIVIDAPKFITPNNDGAFDTWHIIGVETLPGTIVSIFDRYGKLLKQLTHTSSGWNGTYNGNLMPSSDYWWSAEVKGADREFTATGHFTLKR